MVFLSGSFAWLSRSFRRPGYGVYWLHWSWSFTHLVLVRACSWKNANCRLWQQKHTSRLTSSEPHEKLEEGRGRKVWSGTLNGSFLGLIRMPTVDDSWISPFDECDIDEAIQIAGWYLYNLTSELLSPSSLIRKYIYMRRSYHSESKRGLLKPQQYLPGHG